MNDAMRMAEVGSSPESTSSEPLRGRFDESEVRSMGEGGEGAADSDDARRGREAVCASGDGGGEVGERVVSFRFGERRTGVCSDAPRAARVRGWALVLSRLQVTALVPRTLDL